MKSRVIIETKDTESDDLSFTYNIINFTKVMRIHNYKSFVLRKI